MFAIVNIAGQQFKVQEGQEIFVHRLAAKEGDKMSFDEIMLVSNDKETNVGSPTLKGASVNASVIEHLQGDKVIVFRKKRRKGFKVKNGHRQQFTKIKIDSISV